MENCCKRSAATTEVHPGGSARSKEEGASIGAQLIVSSDLMVGIWARLS
jgi:hypothetical protein